MSSPFDLNLLTFDLNLLTFDLNLPTFDLFQMAVTTRSVTFTECAKEMDKGALSVSVRERASR